MIRSKLPRVTKLSLRRFELLRVPHQETILPLDQRLTKLKTSSLGKESERERVETASLGKASKQESMEGWMETASPWKEGKKERRKEGKKGIKQSSLKCKITQIAYCLLD